MHLDRLQREINRYRKVRVMTKKKDIRATTPREKKVKPVRRIMNIIWITSTQIPTANILKSRMKQLKIIRGKKVIVASFLLTK